MRFFPIFTFHYCRWRSSFGSSIVTDAKRYRVRSWVGQKIFVATLNISELHHPKWASNMIDNFDEIVSNIGIIKGLQAVFEQ